MFAEERQEKLLGILREKRKVAVSEMCDVFNVSGATIRADLRQLEEEGLLTRTHGGAVLRTRASFEQASLNRRFNIIYIMRTHVVVAKLRCPSSLTK